MTDHANALPDRLHHLKGRVLRAKHRDGETEVVVLIDDLLALFHERDRYRSARRKYRWLYRRQRHLTRRSAWDDGYAAALDDHV